MPGLKNGMMTDVITAPCRVRQTRFNFAGKNNKCIFILGGHKFIYSGFKTVSLFSTP